MRSTNSFHSLWPGLLAVIACLLFGCDKKRLYEEHHEFTNRSWIVQEEPTFKFAIPDSVQTYTLYYNVRNSLDYPFSRIFVTFQVYDSAGHELVRKLVYNDLFDQKTGQPFGESGLGDLYDHQFPLLNHFRFRTIGTYSVKLTQFMRQDTLPGVLAVGVRVERDAPAVE